MRQKLRRVVGKHTDPSAAIIDFQSVKTDEQATSKGYDAGKKVKGRKRHILVDTLGLLLTAKVLTAEIEDRDGAKLLLAEIKEQWPRLQLIFGRRRLSRQTDSVGGGAMLGDIGSCQTIRPIKRFCRAAEALDCRENFFVVESKSAIGQRL